MTEVAPQVDDILAEISDSPSAHKPSGGVLSVYRITLLGLSELVSYLDSLKQLSTFQKSNHPITWIFAVYALFHAFARARVKRKAPAFQKLIPIALVVLGLAQYWNQQRRQAEIKKHADRLNTIHQMWTMLLFVIDYNRAKQVFLSSSLFSLFSSHSMSLSVPSFPGP